MRNILAVAIVMAMLMPFAARAVEDASPDDAGPTAPEAKEVKDSWIGCWSRLYDAAHLSKHPDQLVTALTVGIDARTPQGDSDPGPYAVRVAANFRGKTETYAGPETARCTVAAKTRLRCFMDGMFLGQFTIEQAGKNLKLALPETTDDLVLVPGVELSAFVRLSPQNPEHSVFLLNPAPGKVCGQ